MTYRAKIAYEAYSKTTDNGKEMLKFEDLPESIQLAWANAAQAVAVDITEREVKKQELRDSIESLEQEEMPDDAHTDWSWDQQDYITDLKEELKKLE